MSKNSVKKKSNSQLDLDALNSHIGEVKLGGKKYKMYQPDYENFVLMPEVFQSLGNSGELNREEKMELINEMRTLLTPILPDVPPEDISGLTFFQLMGLIEFVSDKFVEQMNITPDEDDGTGKS